MKARHWNWGQWLMAVGLALSISAAGACGDDDEGTDAGSEGGSGGKSGSGGTGGKAGGSGGSGGGGAISASACEAAAETATANTQPAACYTCSCKDAADRPVLEKCNAKKDCWALIQCVASKCADAANQTTCAGTMCTQFIGAATEATAVGPILQDKCADECVPEPGDGGTDAGN